MWHESSRIENVQKASEINRCHERNHTHTFSYVAWIQPKPQAPHVDPPRNSERRDRSRISPSLHGRGECDVRVCPRGGVDGVSSTFPSVSKHWSRPRVETPTDILLHERQGDRAHSSSCRRRKKDAIDDECREECILCRDAGKYVVRRVAYGVCDRHRGRSDELKR